MVASMRPRHYTAENRCARSWRRRWSGRFNEAAALHRGKLSQELDFLKADESASMRPRHYTAENDEEPPEPLYLVRLQ